MLQGEISGNWEGGKERERSILPSELVFCSGGDKASGGRCDKQCRHP